MVEFIEYVGLWAPGIIAILGGAVLGVSLISRLRSWLKINLKGNRMKRVSILVLMTSISLLSSLCFAIERNEPEKWAFLCVDEDLIYTLGYETLEQIALSPKIQYWIQRYIKEGYKLTRLYSATDENIKRALIDGRVKAMAYFGHGGGLRNPTFGNRDAKGWKTMIFQHYLEQYRNNHPQDKAYELADQQSQNFGLYSVANHSCYSSEDDSLARLFVRPGGLYYGTPVLYRPCNPFALFSDESDMILSEYRIPSFAGRWYVKPNWLMQLDENGVTGTLWGWDGSLKMWKAADVEDGRIVYKEDGRCLNDMIATLKWDFQDGGRPTGTATIASGTKDELGLCLRQTSTGIILDGGVKDKRGLAMREGTKERPSWWKGK